MRVIAGTYRSRRLVAPRGMNTRPTSDRLRETLFNVVGRTVGDAVFSDLYAGSGAVGIEALSRGARLVYFTDQAPAALAAVRTNLEALHIKTGFRIEAGSVAAALRRLATCEPATIAVLDPPYDLPDQYALTLGAFGQDDGHLLAPDGVVVAEHRRKDSLEERYGSLLRYRVLEQGDASLSFYRR